MNTSCYLGMTGIYMGSMISIHYYFKSLYKKEYNFYITDNIGNSFVATFFLTPFIANIVHQNLLK